MTKQINLKISANGRTTVESKIKQKLLQKVMIRNRNKNGKKGHTFV